MIQVTIATLVAISLVILSCDSVEIRKRQIETVVTASPYYGPNSNRFLRRSQAADPEVVNSPSESTGSTTPFPYYNVWDDLVANHNLTTNGDQNESNKSREVEEERPRFFRTRLPVDRPATESSSASSSPSPVETNSGTNGNSGSDRGLTASNDNSGSPTPPPRFGLRRKVVVRPQPTPRPYQNNSNNATSNDFDRPISRPTSASDNNDNANLVPSVYYVEDPESIENVTPRENSVTYSPPLVSQAVPTTPAPFLRVTSPPLDTRRRRPQDARNLNVNDQPSNSPDSSENNNGDNNAYTTTTRRPYLRRVVVSGIRRKNSTASNCRPQDVNCIPNSRSPVASDTQPGSDLPFSARYDPRWQPEDESRPSTTPKSTIDNRFRPPVTEYFLNDQTTPSTTFFDSTRRPTSRSPQDIYAASPVTPRYEDDSVNYVRRIGSERPRPNGRQRQISRPTTTTTEASTYHNNIPVRPVDSRANFNDGRYRPSRPTESEPTHPREPKREEASYTGDANTIADILEDPGLFLEKRPISFSMFKDLLRRSGLQNYASSKSPITVFLPTDDAFERLENKHFTSIYRDPAELQNFLLHHLVNYPVKPTEMRDGLVIRSINNQPITIKSLEDGQKVYANGSPILAATEATNGYVYVLGKVLTKDSDLEDDGKVKRDIVQSIEQLENASIFASLLKRSNLIPQLQDSEGPWTILVPDNDAFAEIQPQTRDEILSSPKLIQSLVGNHIINGSFGSDKLSRSRNILPLIGSKPHKIRAFPGALLINNQASVKLADLEAKNGLVHTISRVLLPDELKSNQVAPGRGRERALQVNGNNNNINLNNDNQFNPRRGLYTDPNEPKPRGDKEEEEIQELAPKLKSQKFISWLEGSGVLNELRQNKTPFTVIEPTDEAIEKLPAQVLSQLESEPKNLRSLLAYHVVPGQINLDSLINGTVLKSSDDRPIQVTRLNDNSTSLSGVPVLSEYNQSEITFLTVDRVLYPPQGNIFDIISGSPILTNMSQIIKTANLVSQFADSQGPWTLFAPTDEAFSSLEFDQLFRITRDVKSSRAFLLRHTLRDIQFTSAIPMNNPRGINVENLNKTTIKLLRKPNYVTANGVPLAYADITATNGVIHVLSRPL